MLGGASNLVSAVLGNMKGTVLGRCSVRCLTKPTGGVWISGVNLGTPYRRASQRRERRHAQSCCLQRGHSISGAVSLFSLFRNEIFKFEIHITSPKAKKVTFRKKRKKRDISRDAAWPRTPRCRQHAGAACAQAAVRPRHHLDPTRASQSREGCVRYRCDTRARLARVLCEHRARAQDLMNK